MTPEECTKRAELLLVPAVQCLVAWALQTVPPERAEGLVIAWLEVMSQAALRSVCAAAAAERRH